MAKNKITWECNLDLILLERKKRGLPHLAQWLAQEVDVSPQTIYNILKGSDLMLSTAEGICKAVDRDFKTIWIKRIEQP